MKQPGLTEDACANCNWPEAEHNPITAKCPDYNSPSSIIGWLNTRYRRKQLALTESVMTHMLADIDQIVTEWEMDSTPRPTERLVQDATTCRRWIGLPAMSERLRLFNRCWDPIWDSDKAPFGLAAYRLIATWVNAVIDYEDGTRWVGRLHRCREGIRREAYPDPNLNVFRNLISWPES